MTSGHRDGVDRRRIAIVSLSAVALGIAGAGLAFAGSLRGAAPATPAAVVTERPLETPSRVTGTARPDSSTETATASGGKTPRTPSAGKSEGPADAITDHQPSNATTPRENVVPAPDAEPRDAEAEKPEDEHETVVPPIRDEED